MGSRSPAESTPRDRRERRRDHRLRVLVDEMKAEIASNRNDLQLQFKRIAQLQVELDAIKKATAASPAEAVPPTRTS